MFSLLNMNKVKPHLAIRIESPDGDSTELTIGPMISKRNREELIPERQYELLNGYLNYKGVDFKRLLYMAIINAEAVVEASVFERGLSNPPTAEIFAILDMFNMDDVEHYVKNIYKVTPPQNLKESFDQKIESDGLGTRVQTYIQQDYYELAALTIPIKVILGLLGQYAIRKAGVMSPIHREYVLYGLFSAHPIAKHPAAIKIKEWGEVLIKATINTNDLTAITVIEKQIPSSELSNYLLAVVLIQKLGIGAIVTDTHERNLITRIYNYIINKLKLKGGSSSKIRDKKPLADVDSATGDKESIIESYRMVTSITAGLEEELNWYASNTDLIIRDAGYDIDMCLLEEVTLLNQCFRSVPITREQVVITSFIFKHIMDVRSFEYLNIESIINLLSLGYVVLWTHGHKELAVLVNSKPLPVDVDCIDINVTPNIRLDIELKAKLAELYPYEKQVNKTKTASIVESTITDLTYQVFQHKWLANSPDRCIKELFGDRQPTPLPVKIKDHLARLIIFVEERNNANTNVCDD